MGKASKMPGKNVMKAETSASDLSANPAQNGHLPHVQEKRMFTAGGSGPLQAEFERLYQTHSREVWALAYARWMDASAAQDIMQESFLRLWKQWEKQELISNPRAWLLRVARNLAEDYAKSSFRRNGTSAPQAMNAISSPASQLPLEAMEKQEMFGQLRSELEQMARDDREILTLRYALDYDTEAIAQALSIQPSSVHMRLSRARQRLAQRLISKGVTHYP